MRQNSKGVTESVASGVDYVLTDPSSGPVREHMSASRNGVDRKGREKTVLVVDDDPGHLLLVEAALAGGGFLVTTVGDGDAALDHFSRQTPDCVILDISLPGLSGIEVCRILRERADGHLLPILVLTGRNDLAAIVDAYAAGASDFAHKGLNPRLLVERVKFLLRDREAQDEIWSSRSKLLLAQRIARVGHWELALDGRSISVSPMVHELLALAPPSPGHYEDFIAMLEPEERDAVRKSFRECAAGSGGFSIDHCMRSGSDTEIWVHQEAELVGTASAGEGAVIVTLQDLTRLHRAEEMVRQLSYFDAPSGLPNRRYLTDLVSGALGDDAGARASGVVALRVHGFERIERAQGARVASAMLARVGRAVEAELARISLGGDIVWRAERPAVCRIAEDELAVLVCSRVSVEHVAWVTRSVLASISSRPDCPDAGHIPAVSAGIALWPMDGTDAEDLLSNAQAAAGQAADAGSCEFFSPLPQAISRRQLLVESALRGAIDRGELHLVYQPRVAADTLDFVGAECLVRWVHPQLGCVSPEEFIRIAEETGLIDELGRWVLSEGCRQLADWQRRFGRDFLLSVNVSARQLRDPGLVEAVREAIVASRLPAGLIEIEITETSVIDSPDRARAVLTTLRETGVRVALDDFGTGYSSLAQIRRLPLDCMKVDRTLLADLHLDRGARDVVAATIAMARALRLRSVAEGVEDAATLELLRELGCDEIQGYYVARPMKVAEFEQWFDSGGSSQLRLRDEIAADALAEPACVGSARVAGAGA